MRISDWSSDVCSSDLPRTPGGRRAVPSRVDPDRAWACVAEEFPGAVSRSSPSGSTTMPITPQEALQRTIEHREIFHDEMVDLMRQVMRGEVSPVMTAAIFAGLRVKKETIDEIAGAAKVLREFALPVPVAAKSTLVDIVGTGGAGAHTFNISTASIFVVAARSEEPTSELQSLM